MKKNVLFLLMAGLVILTSCGQASDAKIDKVESTAVETNAPNADYPPAFAGQTRVNGVTTKTPYEFTILNKDLASPWGIRSLPDGRLLITEKTGGNLRIASADGSLSAPIKGLPAVNSEGQGGLLGIAIDPAFEQDRMGYWVFSESVPGGTRTWCSKGRLSDDVTKL